MKKLFWIGALLFAAGTAAGQRDAMSFVYTQVTVLVEGVGETLGLPKR